MKTTQTSFLTTHIDGYAQFCRARNHWSDFASKMLSSFERFCVETEPAAVELTQEMADGWCAWRPTEKASSCCSRTSPVRGFIQWMRDRNLTRISVPESPKPERRVVAPRPFTDAELADFFKACDTFPFKGTKQRRQLSRIVVPVIFRLLYSTGMRPPEARLLRCADINLSEGVISIKNSKGPDEHFVVLHDSMRDLLKQYDTAMEKLMPGRVWFFPDPADQPYKTTWLWWQFRRIADSCGIEGGSPYDLRHHYATTNINRWIGMGISFDDKLVYLSKSMGHRKLQSTTYYYSLVPALADVLNAQSGVSETDIIPEVHYEKD